MCDDLPRRQDAARQVALELPADVKRQTGPIGIGLDLREERRQVLGDHLVEHRLFGLAALVVRRLDLGLHTRR